VNHLRPVFARYPAPHYTAKRTAAMIQYDRWRAMRKCRDLTLLRKPPPSFSLPLYMRIDPPAVCAIRTRLRLNRSDLAASLYRRHAVSSPECTRCGASHETIEHVLDSCAEYADLRYRLHAHPILTFDTDVLLGEVSHIRGTSLRKTALSATARFLTAVYRRRRVLSPT
jgi:hypothetical protein